MVNLIFYFCLLQVVIKFRYYAIQLSFFNKGRSVRFIRLCSCETVLYIRRNKNRYCDVLYTRRTILNKAFERATVFYLPLQLIQIITLQLRQLHNIHIRRPPHIHTQQIGDEDNETTRITRYSPTKRWLTKKKHVLQLHK